MPDLPLLGSPAYLLAIPIPPVCVMRGGRSDQHGVGGAWGVPHASAVPAGVPEANQLELFSILAAILHLGNIVFRGRDRRGDGCFVEVGESLLPVPCIPNWSLSCAGCRSHILATVR